MHQRILEITNPCELHIQNYQLKIIQEDQIFFVPIHELSIIIAQVQNIRLSTNDLSILAENHVLFLTLNQKYLPSTMTLSFINNSRQSITMEKQLLLSKRKRNILWNQIISCKIYNQASVLRLLEKTGVQEIVSYSKQIHYGDRENVEALAAHKYFQYYYLGLNRRCESAVNSRLNYGYSIVRGCVAKSLAAHGFLLSKGIHHESSLNAFNLVDDMIEPFRAFVDLNSTRIQSNQIRLTREERKILMETLYMECKIDNKYTTVQNAIEIMVDSLKAFIFENGDLLLPEMVPLNIRRFAQE